MNILASVAVNDAKNNVFNTAVGDRTTLNELYGCIQTSLNLNGVESTLKPIYRNFRIGDVRHSQADVSKAKILLGFEPQFKMQDGIDKAMPWYIEFENKN